MLWLRYMLLLASLSTIMQELLESVTVNALNVFLGQTICEADLCALFWIKQ
jgi:hypothetical protein